MKRKELDLMLKLVCELFNMVDAKVDIMKHANATGKLCNILKYELMTFLMCLSASDGRISTCFSYLVRDKED